MELTLQRVSGTKQDTIGDFYDETHKFLFNTLEDEYRDKKVSKETRIWAGRYKLGIQETITPKTQKYLDDIRLKPWFERHIEILNVPQFRGVYIHLGNDEDDTDACVLTGDWANKQERKVIHSVVRYKQFYTRYYPLLKSGVDIYLNIFDEVGGHI